MNDPIRLKQLAEEARAVRDALADLVARLNSAREQIDALRAERDYWRARAQDRWTEL